MSAALFYGPEILRSGFDMDRIASPEGDPESILIAREEPVELPRPRKIPPRVLAVIREFLPKEEAYLLEAHLMQGQSQSGIGDRLGHRKTSIQYRIHRAMERIRWALALETWDKSREEMWRELGEALTFEQTSFAWTLWSQRWNQTGTARELQSTQSAVRVRIIRLHRTMDEVVTDFAISGGPRQIRIEPYFRDLTAVIQAGAWCMGTGQKQGRRAIGFPKFGKFGGGRKGRAAVEARR